MTLLNYFLNEFSSLTYLLGISGFVVIALMFILASIVNMLGMQSGVLNWTLITLIFTVFFTSVLDSRLIRLFEGNRFKISELKGAVIEDLLFEMKMSLLLLVLYLSLSVLEYLKSCREFLFATHYLFGHGSLAMWLLNIYAKILIFLLAWMIYISFADVSLDFIKLKLLKRLGSDIKKQKNINGRYLVILGFIAILDIIIFGCGYYFAHKHINDYQGHYVAVTYDSENGKYKFVKPKKSPEQFDIHTRKFLYKREVQTVSEGLMSFHGNHFEGFYRFDGLLEIIDIDGKSYYYVRENSEAYRAADSK